jgi:hypothetical protein
MMFRKGIIILSVLFISTGLKSGETLRSVDNNAFQHGEKLVYRIHYGFVNAGETIFEIKKNPAAINGRNCYHVVGTGRSLGAFNWFFKVRDTYESYIDQDALLPWRFVRDVYEGGFTIYNNVKFYHNKNKLTTLHGTYDVPSGVQDVLSAIYYFRTVDYSNYMPGDKFPVSVFIDEKVYDLKVTYVGKEIITTKFGKFRTLKFQPQLVAGTIFKEDANMSIWVTDDENKIPLVIESEVLVGAIKASIRDWSGVKNKLTSKIES